MTKYCKFRIINNMLNNLVNDCKKLLEVYLYRLWSLDRNIDIEFNKPLGKFDSNHFIQIMPFKN